MILILMFHKTSVRDVIHIRSYIGRPAYSPSTIASDMPSIHVGVMQILNDTDKIYTAMSAAGITDEIK